MKAYEGNRLGANSSVIDAHPVGVAIQAFVARGRSFEWGTAKDFLEELCIDADQKLLKQRQWPGTPQGLGNALHRLAPSLRRAGLDVEFSRKKDSTRTRILRVAKISSEGTGRISLTAPLDNAPKETSSTRPLKTNSLDIMDISDGFFAEFRGDSEEGSPQPNGRRVEGRI